MNAVVSHEVYIVVVNSYHRRRTKPPSLRKILLQVMAVCIGSILVVTWFMIDTSWSPFTITDTIHCHTNVGGPTDGSEDPVFNVWTGNIICCLVVTPPILYVIYVSWKVHKGRLLPLKGRTRALAIYFFRIIWLFVLFYIPNVILGILYMNIPPTQPTARSFRQ